MKTIRKTAATLSAQFILCWLAAVCCCALPVLAQPSASAGSASGSGAASGVRAVTMLDGQWRFQVGDDPRWAGPAFDDSSWPTVSLSSPLVEQGIDTYSGYAWYRLKLQPGQLAQFGNLASGQPLSLLVSSNSIGQLDVYANGVEAGHTRGMTDSPAEYQSPPIVVQLNASATGPAVIAIRTWAGPGTTISRGLLRRVELGAASDMAERHALAVGRQWDESVTAPLLVAFLFFCVAILGGFLYLAQRHHPEYLWLSLLCLAVALEAAAGAAFGLAFISLGFYLIFTAFNGRVFMAITLEFILHFSGTESRKFVRVVQIGVSGPSLCPPDSPDAGVSVPLGGGGGSVLRTGDGFAVSRMAAWTHRGRRDAGAVLSGGDGGFWRIRLLILRRAGIGCRISLRRTDFFLGPIEFGTSAAAYTVFLGSLIAVILYRFVRISQEEQRSTAEISAARSVQALLIPTQLPSNRNFMLESAYLPVNGVGGDFFQVLPLKDDSLLIVVGDVSGKGLQAAMNSSTLVGALRNELSHDPATVLNHLNHVLIGAVASPGTAVKELDCAPCFATCLCARVYPDGTTTIANAGHLNPYRDGREIALSGSLPLGVIADVEYEQATFHLNRGDRLVFLSDGVVEATNGEGELFGFERTQQVSNESARYIAQTAQHFGQTDDITVVSLYLSSRTAQPSSEELAYSK